MKAEDILQEVAELKARKSADYQGSAWTEDDYFPFGHQSFIQMLHTKYLRMRSVVEQEDTNYESLEDTLIDMIAYSAMYAAWIRRQNEPDYSHLVLPNSGELPIGITRGMDIDEYEASLDADYARGKIGSDFYYKRKKALRNE